jgi:hypothetical protein
MEKKKEEGLRFNQGKTRYDLVPAFAQEQYAKVLTKGAEKYGDSNWKLGMRWSKVLASLERHLAAIKLGEDTDSETGLLHAAHIMCNAAFLTEYYKIYPQGDDRNHGYLKTPKIGLDLDEVLVSWIDGYKEKYNYPENHEFDSWYLHFNIIGRCTNELDEDFYLNLKPKINPKDMPFEPHCYITSRNIKTEVTEEWLYKNGFPCKPVRTVGLSESKAEVAKEMGVEIFVDDVYKNFLELNKAGICTFLFDAPHNRRFDVGYKRIKSLKDLI